MPNAALDAVLRQMPRGYWLGKHLDEVRSIAKGLRVRKHDLQFLIEEAGRYIDKGQVGRPTNYLVFGLLVDETGLVDLIKRSGEIRPSRREYRGQRIHDVIQPIVENASRLEISNITARYLESIAHLGIIAEGAREVRRNLRRAVDSGRAVKSLLAEIDLLFMSEFEPERRGAPTNEWEHYSREALAEGFSLIYFLYRSGGREFDDISIGGPVDPDVTLSDTYGTLLARGALLRAYHEWEFQVDLGTHFVTDEHGTFVVRPGDDRAEMATRLGYIQSEQARLKSAVEMPERAAKLSEFGDHLHAALKKAGLLRVKERPFRRLVMEVPANPALLSYLKEPKFFAEEVAYLKYSGQSYFVEPNELMEFVVYGSLTVLDLLHVWRLCNVLRDVWRREFEVLAQGDAQAAAQSILAAYHQDQLVDFFAMVIGKEKAAELMKFWEWSGDGVFDIQYQPLLRGSEYYLLPLNVLASSDVIRNSLQLARRRFHDERDPSEDLLAAAFRARQLPTLSGHEYEFDNARGEVDVLTLFDGVAFAFETKNPLPPGNVFELRQTVQYLEKAYKQLDQLRSCWRDAEFRRTVGDRLGIQFAADVPLVTCAVTANRMLSGSVEGGHPVRGLFELISFFNLGGLRMFDQPVSLIRGNVVGSEDLRAYIEGDSLHERMFACMTTYEPEYQVGSQRVRHRSFALNTLKVIQEFELPVQQEILDDLERQNAQLSEPTNVDANA
jgi:hypothetical protein